MPRGRETSPEQDREIRRLVNEGYRPAQIERELDRLGLRTHPYPAIGRRTVQRRVRDMRPADDSEPWSFADADPGEAALIADVVAQKFQFSNGRLWPSIPMARKIAHLRETHPDIPANWAWALARVSLSLAAREQESRCLDYLIVGKLWKGGFQHVAGLMEMCFSTPGKSRFDEWWDLVAEFDDSEFEATLATFVDSSVTAEPPNGPEPGRTVEGENPRNDIESEPA